MHYESKEHGISGFQDKPMEKKLMSHHSRGMMPLPLVADLGLQSSACKWHYIFQEDASLCISIPPPD